MTDEQPHPTPGPLTDHQQTRLDFARRDLNAARTEDLAQLPPDNLILLAEKLRRRLDDTIQLVEEIARHTNPTD